MSLRAGAALVAVVAVVTAAAAPDAYREGPPPGHAGGFGDPHCGACHFDAPVDDTAGSVRIQAPETYRPGKTYRLTVQVEHPALEAAGFGLTTRFLHGDRAGTQAGGLRSPGERVRAVIGDDGLAFASHTATGVAPVEPGVGRWTLEWTAPDGGGPVAIHVAANAANDDDSEFGDRIYLACVTVAEGAAAGQCP